MLVDDTAVVLEANDNFIFRCRNLQDRADFFTQ